MNQPLTKPSSRHRGSWFAAGFLVALLSGSLFAYTRQAEPATAEVRTLVRSTTSWEGSVLPAYPEGQPEITILHITVPPKFKLPLHYHPVINAGVLLEGELTVVTDQDEVLELKAGDAIIEVVDKLHYGFNPGDVPAVIIVFYAGTVGGDITVVE